MRSRRTPSFSLRPGQSSSIFPIHDADSDEASPCCGCVVLTYFRLGQATWITCVSLPAVLVNVIPRTAHPALGLRDLLAVGIWAGGIGLEIIADRGEGPANSAILG